MMFASAPLMGRQIVTNALVSYYTLDAKDIDGEVVKDLVGKNNGKMVGAPKSVPGHIGEALEFAGQPDCVELPQVFAIGEGPVSYECWFIKPAKTDWSYLMVNKSDFHNNFFRLGFNQNTGQLRFYTEHENETNKAWVTAEDYADGNWHHVVASRDGNQGKIYVDGKLVKEDVAMDGDIGGDKTSWYLAQDGNTNGYLAGTMDEVRIYRRALTAEEVQQNFDATGLAVCARGKLSHIWAMIKK
jgi:hypothetical protein